MAENSMLWTTSGTGDGPGGGFTQANWVDLLRYIFGGLSSTSQAVLDLSSGSDLVCSGTASPVAVASGAAIVYGFFYWNTASVNVAVTTPSIGTTGFRIVLRAGWAAQTVRIALITSSDGVGTAPAVTQSAGTTWEISLATGTITTGGVIALTDTRAFVHMASRLDRSKIDGGTSTRIPFNDANGLLTDSSGVAYDDVNKRIRVQGATAGLHLDETDGPTKGMLAVLATGILTLFRTATGFGGAEATPFQLDIVNGQLTINAQSALPPLILSANAQGQRIDGLRADEIDTLSYRRQGGSATDWQVPGTTNYTPTTMRHQVGIVDTGIGGGSVLVTFPTAFTNKPHIMVFADNGITSAFLGVSISVVSTTQFQIDTFTTAGAGVGAIVTWVAEGPM